DRMEHFVEENVIQIPARHEHLIQKRVNANHAVFFLNCSKNKMIFWPMFSSTAPFHFVVAQPAVKITSIELIENRTQIEMFSFLSEIELPLHRQPAIRDFPFRFLRHNWALSWGTHSILNGFKVADKISARFSRKLFQSAQIQRFTAE